jgi:pimeloyl-ACP methyl ester carboxylesterase
MPPDERFNQTHRLDDGRILGFADFGDSSGVVVLYHHGWPGSRLDIAALDAVAAEEGVRIVAPDRSGFGLSSPDPGRTLADAAADAVDLLDALGIDHFGVLGLSGGGPSALATGQGFAERVGVVVMVSTWGPMGRRELLRGEPLSDRVVLELAAKAPWAIRPYTASMAILVKRLSDRAMDRLIAGSLSATDQELLQARPDLAPALAASARAALRQGGEGAATDVRVTAQPWGFTPSQVGVPVRFHHGTDDPAVPIHISEVLSTEIPDATLQRYPGEGHLAIYRHAKEILADLQPRHTT